MINRFTTLVREQLSGKQNIPPVTNSFAQQQENPEHTAVENIHTVVARQPVFDDNGNIWGYELLYRKPDAKTAAFVDGTVATSSVIINGFDVVRPGLRPGQKVLINFTSDLIVTQVLKLLPSQICIAEILEDTEPTPETLASVKELKAAGYSIAVDDYTGQENLLPFLPLADIIKFDILMLSPDSIGKHVELLRDYKCKLLAEKVEDKETFAECSKLGFSLFQGYFFSKPELVQGRKISPSQAGRMHILAICSKEDASTSELTTSLRHDPIIMVRFLKFVNSAYFGFRTEIKDIQHALSLVGRDTFMHWLCVTALADMDSAPLSRELAYLAAQRARFLESLAILLEKRRCLPPNITTHSAFLTGMFSLLESALGVPLEDILDGIPIDPAIIAALHNESSPYQIWCSMMLSYERGEWDQVFILAENLHLTETELNSAYADAVKWTTTYFSSI